jgi:hypothetical protein
MAVVGMQGFHDESLQKDLEPGKVLDPHEDRVPLQWGMQRHCV